LKKLNNKKKSQKSKTLTTKVVSLPVKVCAPAAVSPTGTLDGNHSKQVAKRKLPHVSQASANLLASFLKKKKTL